MPVAQVHRSDITLCGRRDVSLPRSIQKRRQKDEETRLTWYLKDEVMRRGRVYYAKLAGGRSMFVAMALISDFAALWMPLWKDKRSGSGSGLFSVYLIQSRREKSVAPP